MRVLLATHNARLVGGAEAYVRAVVPLLRGRGLDVGLLTIDPAGAGDDAFVELGADRLSAAGLPASATLDRIAGWGPDVVYAHGLGDPALDLAVATRFPTVAFAHNYGGMCISGTKCQGARPCGRPLGPACLGLYLPRRCGGRNPVAAVGMYRTEVRRRAALRAARAVVVASGHMAAEAVRNGIPAVHPVPPFPPGVTPDPEPPAPRPFSNRILFVGRLTDLKGWAHLLVVVPRAAQILGRRLTLVLSGAGPDRAAVETAARGLSIEFLGWVDGGRREAETRAADLLAVPSIWPEPFGLTGIEAGCVGTPTVAYAVGGIPDWLEAGVSGESAAGSQPDSRDLAAATARALADPDHWQRLRVGAWETARRFSPEAHLDRLIPILEAAAR